MAKSDSNPVGTKARDSCENTLVLGSNWLWGVRNTLTPDPSDSDPTALYVSAFNNTDNPETQTFRFYKL